MKDQKTKFLVKGCMFIFVFLLIATTFNYIYFSKIHVQKNRYRTYQMYLEKEELNTVFFGDSHVSFAINPDLIPKSFNYAEPSETYEMTFYKVRKVLEEQPEVETIVLPIDPHSFSNYRGNSTFEAWYWTQIIPLDDLSEITEKSKGVLFLTAKFPYIGRGEEFQRIFDASERTEILDGWQKRTGNFATVDQHTEAQERVEAQFNTFPDIVSKKYVEALKNILRLAEEKEIKVVLVKYPLSGEYLNALNSKGFKPEVFYKGLREDIKEYKEVMILDAQERYKDQPELFNDPDHLNEQGALEFSQFVAEYLSNISMTLDLENASLSLWRSSEASTEERTL